MKGGYTTVTTIQYLADCCHPVGESSFLTNQYNETAVLNTAQVNIYSTSQLGPFHHLFFGWWFQSWIWLFSFADPGCLGWEEFETTSQIQSQRFEMLMQAVILRKLVIRHCNWLWVKHGAIILQLLLFIQFYSLQRFLETFDHSFNPIFVVPLVPLFDGTNLTHTHCFCCKKDRAPLAKKHPYGGEVKVVNTHRTAQTYRITTSVVSYTHTHR